MKKILACIIEVILIFIGLTIADKLNLNFILTFFAVLAVLIIVNSIGMVIHRKKLREIVKPALKEKYSSFDDNDKE